MSGSAAAVLDFAAAQILREGTAPGGLPAGLSAVLERMVGAFGAAFGVRAALAFQTSAGQPPAVLAAYPREAVDAALLARIGALSVAQRDAASDAPVELLLGGPAAASALVAYSAPVGHGRP